MATLYSAIQNALSWLAMWFKCERCGAPLDVPAGGSVRCPYCGTTASAPAPALPPPPAQPYGHHHGHPGHPQVQLGQVPARRSGGVGRIVGTFSVLAIVGSVVAGLTPFLINATTSAPVLQKALAKVTSGSGLPTLSLTSWSSSDPGC